ncbi:MULTISPECIES: Gfo/Idh/MocA family protein [unclassified Caballeronia]|uniref:Gfo/Idh/MocA family protein n=1 Tax=unclassified Caballeronia TaxID=2646786 RepID=UPI0020278FA2|nr:MULTISPECIES: Gfo/Idh/MocA family oxidoreductase [unclassified Caballeronia]
MRAPLKIGVVGVGTVSLRGVIPHLIQSDIAHRVQLTALCDPVESRVRGAAEKFGVAQAFTSYEHFLDEADIDAVTLATPIGIHFEQGKAALLAGKHVHFNKTMTVSTAEADELIALAKERDLKIVASPGEMLRPHNQAIKRMVEDGTLGTLAWAICGAAFENYHEDEPERDNAPGTTPIDPGWYFKKPGGGPLYDMAVYALHGLTGILGPARAVTALSGVRLPERTFKDKTIVTECDDNTIMLLDFGRGLFAVVYGTAAGGLRDSLDFSGSYFGTRGTIAGLLLNGKPFDYANRDIAISAPDHGMRAGFGGNEWILPNITGPHRDIPEQHVFADVMQLVDWVVDGTPSVASAEHARHVIEIIEAAFRSAETGIAQALQTTF